MTNLTRIGKFNVLLENRKTGAIKTRCNYESANNEWKCDCNEKYGLQTWLPKNQLIVLDNRLVYCYENLSQSENATVLSILPPSSSSNSLESRDIVKVNFWTFAAEIDKLFCQQGEKSIFNQLDNATTTVGVADQDEDDPSATFDLSNQVWLIFAVSVGFSSLLFIAIFTIVRKHWYSLLIKNDQLNSNTNSSNSSSRSQSKNRRILYDRYSPAGKNLHIQQFSQSPAASPNLSNGTSTNPERNSLLQCKLFLLYSKSDEQFVTGEMLTRLERLYPYYHQICLLHRDMGQYANFDRQVQEALITIDRSLHVILLVTKNSLHDKLITTLFSYLAPGPNSSKQRLLLRNKNGSGNFSNFLIMVLLDPDIRPHQLPNTMNQCVLYYTDAQFWSKFIAIMDSDNENCDGVADLKDDSSSAYDSVIVPSLFV